VNSVQDQLSVVAWVCPQWLRELCRFFAPKTRRNLQWCSRSEQLRHVYDLTTKTGIARQVQISVHVETAGLAGIRVLQFCTAGTGSRQLEPGDGVGPRASIAG